MDTDLPHHINYWITSTSKHDCYFNVGTESGCQERIGAVKILLMGHSEVFRKMLDSNECALAETGDISVPDTDPDTFRNVLKCIYGGTEIVVRKLSFEESISLLYVCEKYLLIEIKHKISTCLLEVHQPLSVNHALLSLLNPASLENQILADAVSKIIQTDTEKILNDNIFKCLDINALIFIANQKRLSVKEIDLWKAVLKWGQNKVDADPVKDLKSHLLKLLPLIRFCTMDSYDFCTHVVPSNVLTHRQISKICLSIGTKTVQIIKGVNHIIIDRYRKPDIEIEIFYILNPISTFTGRIRSKSVEMNGFRWCILLEKQDSRNTLGFFLQCKSIVAQCWKCCASAELMVVNHITEQHCIRSFDDRWFNEKEFDWGYKDFLQWQELVEPGFGYLKNNSIEVRVKVVMKSE